MGQLIILGQDLNFFFQVILWPSMKVEMMSGDVLESWSGNFDYI